MLAECQAKVMVPPQPAAGHHDSKEYPELDEQQAPAQLDEQQAPAPQADPEQEGSPCSPCTPPESDWAAVFSEADLSTEEPAAAPTLDNELEGADWGPDPEAREAAAEAAAAEAAEAAAVATEEAAKEAATRSKEATEDPHNPPIEPWCTGLTTAEDFGLTDVLAKYLNLEPSALQDFVPLLRVQFKEEGLMAKVAEITLPGVMGGNYLEIFVSDATLLREQHANLVRRRSCFLQRWEGRDPTPREIEYRLPLFMKEHRKDFANSAAQKATRQFDREVTGWMCARYTYIYIYTCVVISL